MTHRGGAASPIPTANSICTYDYVARGYGATAPKAFGAGGKGIRTPDFQLAKLALYQLSYAPEKNCGM
jgi:hypothetical protein